MRDRHVTLNEHLNDSLQEGSDLVSTKRVDGGQPLVLAETLKDVLPCVDTGEEDADVVHGVH